MAIIANLPTLFGESRKLYIRLNNIEVSNHGEKTLVKFRGFLSKETYLKNSNYLWERDVEFFSDITLPLWEQSYNELKRILASENIPTIDDH